MQMLIAVILFAALAALCVRTIRRDAKAPKKEGEDLTTDDTAW